ncbi:MAG TPA: alkaline phosphatase family protein, partial [Flavobacteriia bacterium]|nr:alkaline phosphatase family protein [Flavobacteriia bacterium]
MRIILFLISISLFSCKQEKIYKIQEKSDFKSDVTLSFGSCNNQNIKNNLFKEILKNKPTAFVWGGDIIYSDTKNPQVLKENYELFKKDS